MDKSFFERILKVFKNNLDTNYDHIKHKSKHWKSYYDNFNFIEGNLNNFRSKNFSTSKLSEGFDDAREFNFSTFSEIEKKVSYEFLYERLESCNIGNSDYTYKHRDKYVNYNNLIHIVWLKEIISKLKIMPNVNKNSKEKIVCEIGAGYGSFISLIIAEVNCKILLIDLPEANIASSFYLKEKYPNKRFYLFDNYIEDNKRLPANVFSNYDIVILPPECNFGDDFQISFFINTRSMMEMNMSAINFYFKFIQKNLVKDGYFLNINRYEKRSVGEPIRISEYPYDKNWNVEISKKSFAQPRVHFLLTKRTDKPNKCISDELIRIKELGSEYLISDLNFKFIKLKKIFKKLLLNR